MKIITIAATSLLLAAGSAFAGSDHYGSDWNYPQSTTDKTHTASTNQAGDDRRFAPKPVYRPSMPQDEYGQGIWGH